MVHGDFNVLGRRTPSNTVSQHKLLKIASNKKYTGHQGGFTSMFCKFPDKKLKVSGIKKQVVSTAIPNQELPNNLCKPVIDNSKIVRHVDHLQKT